MQNLKKYFFSRFIFLLFSGLIFLTACEEDTDSDPDPTVTVEADAGKVPRSPVGLEEVVLDGSGSSSSAGSLDYMWEFSSVPSGSSASLSGAVTVSATFYNRYGR
ncbi:MAG: hypothetical protein U5L09_12445 [Bacteroidales bacterium]|nr:hypothetical protein [Bacteroidales bacterium]